MYTLLFNKKFKADLKKLDKSVRDRILSRLSQNKKHVYKSNDIHPM